MARPSNATLSIDGTRFDALSTNLGIDTDHDHTGMPQMGSLRTSISAVIDAHDMANLPFAVLRKLFDLANLATKEKIVPIKIDFWHDENQQDAIASYNFEGWVSSFHLSGGGDANHTLTLRLTPALDTQHYHKLAIGN